jgi:hypothetical protein
VKKKKKKKEEEMRSLKGSVAMSCLRPIDGAVYSSVASREASRVFLVRIFSLLR